MSASQHSSGAGGLIRRLTPNSPADLLSDIATFWPFLLIGPAALALRLPLPFKAIAGWIWLPVVLVIVAQLAGKLRPRNLSKASGILVFFVAWTILSLAWTPDFGAGLRLALSLLSALVAYAWGTAEGPPRPSTVLWLAGFTGLVIVLIGLAVLSSPTPVGGLNPNRILAMGVIPLVAASWYGPRSRLQGAIGALAGLITVALSGSRMASVVTLILIVAYPGFRLPKAGRVLLAIGLITLVAAASTTSAFQERWFVDGEGTLLDLATLNDVQTSGRSEVWSQLAGECERPIFGLGAGASDFLAASANPGFPEPHNEFLRVWCDTGIIGSLLLWGFIFSVLASAWRKAQRSRRRWPHYAAVQVGIALLLLSLTDNPLTTTTVFAIPAALVLGWSESIVEP